MTSMTQSLASVASFVRDMSWDDLEAASSPSDRTLTLDGAIGIGVASEEADQMCTEDVLSAPPASQNTGDGGGGRWRLEVPQTVGLNRTFNADDLKKNLSRAFDSNRTGPLDLKGTPDRTGPLDLKGSPRTGPLDRTVPLDRTGTLDHRTKCMDTTILKDSPVSQDRTTSLDRPGLFDRLRPLNRTFRMRDRLSPGDRAEKRLGKPPGFF